MERRGWSLLCALVFSALFFAPRAHAIPVGGSDSTFQLVFWAEYQCCEVNASYDAASEIFSIASPFGPGAFISTPTFFTRDFTGTYSVTANVDHSGNVSGGTFSLFGQSTELGIPSSQELISGTITGAQNAGGGSSVNALIASIDFFNPLLEVFTAAPTIALLSAPNMPCFCLAGTEFNVWDHDGSFSIIQPDVFGYTSVPEPATWLLLTAAVIGVGVFRSRGSLARARRPIY